MVLAAREREGNGKAVRNRWHAIRVQLHGIGFGRRQQREKRPSFLLLHFSLFPFYLLQNEREVSSWKGATSTQRDFERGLASRRKRYKGIEKDLWMPGLAFEKRENDENLTWFWTSRQNKSQQKTEWCSIKGLNGLKVLCFVLSIILERIDVPESSFLLPHFHVPFSWHCCLLANCHIWLEI